MFPPLLSRYSTTPLIVQIVGITAAVGLASAFSTLGVFSTLPYADADPDGSVVSCSRSFPSDPTPFPDNAEEVEDFATAWFDSLSTHIPVANLAEFMDFHSLVMTFPPPPVQDPPPVADDEDDTESPDIPAPITVPTAVCDELGFYKWYSAFQARYTDNHYEIVSLETAGNEEQIHVLLTVRWTGKDIPTGTVFEKTSRHNWTLLLGGPRGFLIEAYLVDPEDTAE